MEQLERRELARLGAGLAGPARGVDRGDHAPRGRQVGREAGRGPLAAGGGGAAAGAASSRLKRTRAVREIGRARMAEVSHLRAPRRGFRAESRSGRVGRAGARAKPRWRRASTPVGGQLPRGAHGVHALDRAPQQLEARRVELVAPLAEAIRPLESGLEPQRHRLAGEQDQVRLLVHLLELRLRLGHGRDDLHARGAGELQDLGDVLHAALRPADDAHLRPRRQRADLVDERHVAGAHEHRHDRHAPGDVRLRLVRVEGRGRDQVVVEAVEAVREVVEEDRDDLDPLGERLGDPLRVHVRVRRGALGEEHADVRPRALALGGGGERGLGHLVRREPQLRGAPQRLRDDAGQRVRAATDGRAVHHPRPRAVAPDHVAGVRQAPVDGADRVRVHAQRGPELADRRQAGARQQAPDSIWYASCQ